MNNEIGPQRAAPKSVAAINAEVNQLRSQSMPVHCKDSAYVHRLHEIHGYSIREIQSLTGYSLGEIKSILGIELKEYDELRRTAHKLLKDGPPFCFRGTLSDWRRCVVANFGEAAVA